MKIEMTVIRKSIEKKQSGRRKERIKVARQMIEWEAQADYGWESVGSTE